MKNTDVLVTRNGLMWLLIAQVLTIAPLLFYIPWIILGLWIFCAAWRIQIFRMKLNYPSRGMKLIFITIICCGIYFIKGTLIGLEGGLVLLVSAFSLKLIELRTKRDALVVIYIGFLLIAALYLYDNHFVTVIYSLLPFITLLTALIGINQIRLANYPLGTIKQACILVIQAIPLMVVLFFFFPRFDPLWTFPSPNSQQMSGLSDKMTPGEMANMARSSELVLRAVFDDTVPNRKALYWRALSLEYYNGRTWSQAWDLGAHRSPAPYLLYNKNDPHKVSYKVVMQPSSHNWLIALDTPVELPEGVRQVQDFRMVGDKPIDSLYSYQVTSYTDVLKEPEKTPRAFFNTQLPNTDARAKAFGRNLQATYNGDTAKIVEALLNHYRNNEYFYTLETPDLGDNSVDEFFFNTKRGFCEHYAGATAFILRAAGIPSRVVLGYQGGELNTQGNFIQVRQFDAHAWVEYWQQGKGWIRIDPTFQVAPERIELGLDAALSSEDKEVAGNNAVLGYGSVSFLANARMMWESFNNEWDVFISGYTSAQQDSLLKAVFGKMNIVYLLLLLVVAVCLMAIVWFLLLFKPWGQRKPAILRYYDQFEVLLGRYGLRRMLGEGPESFYRRAIVFFPAYQSLLLQFHQAFMAFQYQEKGSIQDVKTSLKLLKKAFKQGYKK